MAVYPNSDCQLFCYWMLNVSWQELTPPRLSLINTVYTASINGTSVSDNDFNNFTQITSWRYPYYIVWRDNISPYSIPPTGTSDFWFNASSLQLNTTNSFGTCSTNGMCSRVNDILGGTVFGIQSIGSQQPTITKLSSNNFAINALSFNGNSNECFSITNGLTLTKNKAGYTVFIIGQGTVSASNRPAIHFSTGTSNINPRFAIRCNTAGNWTLEGQRLDTDTAQIIVGTSSVGSLQIVCGVIDYSTGYGAIYQNGIITVSSNALTTAGNTSNTNSLTAYFGAINAIQGFLGTITDCMAFNTALSNTDILTITTWLNSLRNIY